MYRPTQPHSGKAPSGTLRGVHPGSERRGGASPISGKVRGAMVVGLPLRGVRVFQAVFYVLAFFRLDGFAVPAPAPLTQAVTATTCVTC